MDTLSKKITFGSLIKFATPTIIMMVFMSLYTMADGIFVTRFVGTNALSAVNIIFPLVSVVIGLAVMMAAGGSAIVAAKLGENKNLEAKSNFTLITIVAISMGILIMVLGQIFIEPLIKFLGATSLLHDYCYEYAKAILFFVPFAMLQMLFQYFFVVVGKPIIGMGIIFLGGMANIILDYVFIGVLNMGVSGAGIATGIGYSIPAIFGLVYFTFNKKNSIHFVKPKFDKKMLFKTFTNGSSEMVTNIASAITTLLFNLIILKLAGEDGVAAITIVLYGQFLLTAIYLGYSSGIAPIISYNFGNKNSKNLKKTLKHSLTFIIISSCIIVTISSLLAGSITSIFPDKGTNVYELAVKGFRIFGIAYLFMGINIFASAMFTALNKGLESAIISFLRTFLFLITFIIVMPKIFGLTGVWLSVPLAELLSLLISVILILRWKKYLKNNVM